MQAGELPPAELYIVDGPHGHGRSIAFQMIARARDKACHVLVDDANHYSFLHDAAQAFAYNVLYGEFLPQKRWALLQVA